MNSIDRLSTLLDQLENKAKQTDIKNASSKVHRLIENTNLFSSDLFTCQSDQFSPYVKEVQRKIIEFSRLVAANKSELSLLLLQHIEQQISALANALQSNSIIHQAAKLSFEANNKVRIKKSNAKKADRHNALTKKIMLTSHQLYQKLNEHHEFERRLMDMVAAREIMRTKCKKHESEKLSSEVLALHQRLGRCRKAISIIERDIVLVEKR